VSLRGIEEVPSDTLVLKLPNDVERGDIEAIFIPTKDQPYVADPVPVHFGNKAGYEGVVEHGEEGRFREVGVDIGLEVTLGDEARIGRYPGLQGDLAEGGKVIFLPGPDYNSHE